MPDVIGRVAGQAAQPCFQAVEIFVEGNKSERMDCFNDLLDFHFKGVLVVVGKNDAKGEITFGCVIIGYTVDVQFAVILFYSCTAIFKAAVTSFTGYLP